MCGTQRKKLCITCADTGAAPLQIAQYRDNGGNAGGDVAFWEDGNPASVFALVSSV